MNNKGFITPQDIHLCERKDEPEKIDIVRFANDGIWTIIISQEMSDINFCPYCGLRLT